MEAKHTPGPWVWACDSYGKVQHSRKYDCVGAVLHEKGGDRLVTVAARIENNFDARLIAAAPELLEAAHAACADLEYAKLTGEYKPSFKGLERLRAAIAKATGQNSAK